MKLADSRLLKYYKALRIKKNTKRKKIQKIYTAISGRKSSTFKPTISVHLQVAADSILYIA